MEKSSLSKRLKVGMLCFLISLLLWNCEKQEDAFQTVSNKITSVVDFNELPTAITDAIGEINPTSGHYQKGGNGLILNKDQIIKVVDSLSNTSYSLKFSLPNTPKNVIYNLVVTTNEDNITQKPFIIKYTIDNLEEITHDNDFVDYTSMKAKIEFYEYQKFLSSNHLKQKMAYSYYNRPCYTYDYDGYGGNGSYGNQGNNSGTGSSGFVSGTLFVWRNSGGSILGITWSFTDGTNGYALKGGNNCRSSSGGSMQGGSTGLNFGNNGPIDPRDEECGEGETFVDGICLSNENVWYDGDVVVYEPDNPITDVAHYLKCYDITRSATFTVYVAEPNPGSGDTYNGKFVGHTYVSIQQGIEISTFGFYPTSNSIYPAINNSSSSVLGDDGSGTEAYTVSISKTVTATQLQQIISASVNHNSTYHLDDSNCTDFAINLGNLAGLGLPEANGTWPLGGGSNPGTLGKHIRSISPSDGVTVNTNAGTSPATNKGC